jgi:hypothetical protein
MSGHDNQLHAFTTRDLRDSSRRVAFENKPLHRHTAEVVRHEGIQVLTSIRDSILPPTAKRDGRLESADLIIVGDDMERDHRRLKAASQGAGIARRRDGPLGKSTGRSSIGMFCFCSSGRQSTCAGCGS